MNFIIRLNVRDLAARNLLVKQEGEGYVVKVADYGLARHGDHYSSTIRKFPVKWTAPVSFILWNKLNLVGGHG